MNTKKEIIEELDRWRAEDKEGRGSLIIMTDQKTNSIAVNVNLPATYLRAAINHLTAILQGACEEAADRTVDHARKMMS